MTIESNYIKNYQEYTFDKKKIKSLEDWINFEKKWFNTNTWPIKSKAQLYKESKNKIGPIKLSNRIWGFTFLPYDITPEARYEYVLTLRKIADPIKFPDEINLLKTQENGWCQECPFCEIATNEIDENLCLCPICNRELIYSRYFE